MYWTAHVARLETALRESAVGDVSGSDLIDEVIAAVRGVVPGTPDVRVELVWDPPWTPERMSEEARSRFGWSP